MNIAQTFIEYYDHIDFKDNYAGVLYETFGNDEDEIINRILDLFNVSNYETEKYLKNHKCLDREQAKKVYDHIYENFEDYVKDFSGYWVGSTSLDSVSFGEQEEQLTGIYNHKTGKEYTLPYLKKVCEQEGYFVNGDCAYYDLNAGLHIDLLNCTDKLDELLTTI